MPSQDEFMADAKLNCVCTEECCLDADCPGCDSIDSEWPCPATQEWADLMNRNA